MVGQIIEMMEEERRIADDKRAKMIIGRFPFAMMMTMTIPLQSHPVCDVPLCNNPTPLEAFKEHSETIIDSNNDSSSSDDDSYENLLFGGIDSDILLQSIKNDILREKLLNVNLLIANIEALKDNPASSSDVMTKSSSTSLDLFLVETNTLIILTEMKLLL
ncbi:hypothetical protein Tco_0960166 [Tanacetum coccineum]